MCGVSQGTVDRALHGRPGISSKTKQKILALAEQHGYRPHPAARELLTGDRKTIGALVPGVNTPFFMDLLASIREALVPEGFRFFIAPVNDTADTLAMIGDFAAARARMVIVIPPTSDIVVPATLTREMDVVSVVNPCAGEGVRHALPDEVGVGRLATEYLLERGHRKIAHIVWAGQSWAIRMRAEGYMQAMMAAGQGARVVHVRTNDEVLNLHRDGVTALFCHNDWLAMRAIRAFHTAGVSVPQEVSVLGVDDSPTFVALCPDITTIRYPARQIAVAIRAALAGETPPPIGSGSVTERRTVRPL